MDAASWRPLNVLPCFRNPFRVTHALVVIVPQILPEDDLDHTEAHRSGTAQGTPPLESASSLPPGCSGVQTLFPCGAGMIEGELARLAEVLFAAGFAISSFFSYPTPHHLCWKSQCIVHT